MTHEELQSVVTQAEASLNQGKYEEAERLALQVLSELSNRSSTATSQSASELLHANVQRVLGLVSMRRGDYLQALKYLEEARELSQQGKDHIGVSKALGSIGVVYYYRSDYPQALGYYSKALVIADELGDKAERAKLLGNIGIVYHHLGDSAKALEYVGIALGLDEEAGNRAAVARHLASIGSMHRSLGDYTKAMEYLGKALSMAEELGDKAGQVTYLGEIGAVYQRLSDYSRALEYFGKALDFAEELGDKLGMANQLGNVGIVNAYLGDYSQALEYFRKALSLAEQLGNKAKTAVWLGNIGTVHREFGDFSKALEYYSTALGIDEELGDKAGVANQLGNIGGVLMKLGDHPKALEYLERSMSLNVELGRKSDLLDDKRMLGELYANQANPECDESKAEAYLLESVALSQELGMKYYDSHRLLAELYERQDRWKESKIEFKKYHDLEKEVQSQDARKSAEQTEHRRHIAEREKEIAIARASADAKMSSTTALLHKILPESVATRMINGEEEIADYFPTVSILFADIAGFTPISAEMPAIVVVRFLNYVFGVFDRIIKKHGCEKIKTIGDGYMAVCGAPTPCEDHAERLAAAALEMQERIVLPDSIREYMPEGIKLGVRIGLHTGSIVAGVIGEERFVYDIYSDAVNTAARMESHGEENRIHISNDFFRHMQNRFAMTKNTTHGFVFEKRGEMEIKGKGMMRTYFLERA